MDIIKKYSNRRLYDSEESRYITLDELAEKIRGGTDVQVLDAKAGTDITQSTLTQIIMESRGAAKLLPVPLLTQLIRMQEDALAEFMGRYLAGALELYQSARRGANRVSPYYPLAQVPFAASNAFARMMGGVMGWNSVNPEQPEPTAEDSNRNDIETLQRELEEIKKALLDKES